MTISQKLLRNTIILQTAISLFALTATANSDWRNIRNGKVIPDEGYSDQPYVVKSIDGNNHWLCVMTTGPGNEGAQGQHVIAQVSRDQGATWSEPVDIEPSDGPEASWGVPYITPSGRVYVFYTFNHLRLLPDGSPVTASRQDTLGTYAYKYSDDFGTTWSSRHEVPYRQSYVDRNNVCPGVEPGEINLFWGTGKAIEKGDTFFLPFTKVGQYLVNNTEGWLVRSTNIMTQTDPAKISWEMVPGGDKGIKNSALSSISSEQCGVVQNNGDLYVVSRTTCGYPAYSISSDDGSSWSTPEKIRYADGRFIKTPRANCKVWKASNNRYLLWYHNNSTKSFENRNPVWLAGGIEVNGEIQWSQPEILLFDPSTSIRISYPDLIEHNGEFWITQTQKTVGYVNKLDATLLEGLWNQHSNRRIATEGKAIDLDLQANPTESAPMPALTSLAEDGGFSLDLWVKFDNLTKGQILADSRNPSGRGFVLQTTDNGKLQLTLNDGTETASWDTETGALTIGRWQHIAVIVDGSPDIITFVVNGRLLDGGSERDFGWSRFSGNMADINGAETLTIGSSLNGQLKKLRLYTRYLRTSEAIANYHAWNPPENNLQVKDVIRFNGTYSPDSNTPPSGNSVWNVVRTGAPEILPNSPAAGFCDYNDSADNARIAMTHSFSHTEFNSSPAGFEWEYMFKLELKTKPSGPPSPFGIRNEGNECNGKTIALMFNTDGVLCFANAGFSAALISDICKGRTFVDGKSHTFRVRKIYEKGAMLIRTFVDGDLVDSRPYSDFQDDSDQYQEGFGIWSSTPGTIHFVLNDVCFMNRIPISFMVLSRQQASLFSERYAFERKQLNRFISENYQIGVIL